MFNKDLNPATPSRPITSEEAKQSVAPEKPKVPKGQNPSNFREVLGPDDKGKKPLKRAAEEVSETDEDEEKYISRKHSQVLYKDGKFYLSEEPGAINGTFLNGNKLQTGVKHELHNEDEITLCQLNVVFKV